MQPDPTLVPVTPYGRWVEKEGIPSVSGWIVKDIRGELPLVDWPRKGVKGVYINLFGAEESMDAYVLEIPPGGHTNPEKYVFEEEVVVLSGHGASTVWVDSSRKQTFEWKPGSVFSPPVNSWRQYFNGSADQPVRLLVVTNTPLMMNLFRSPDFLFNCDHVFKDRISTEDDYFTPKGQALPNMVWRANFIDDINTFTLQDYGWRGAGGSGVMFQMSNNTIRSHIAEFPVGTYKVAHRHGAGAYILMLSGTGYTLMWEEGGPKTRIDWQPGSVFVPGDMWFHQHFNTGSEPARYFAVHCGYFRVLLKSMSDKGYIHYGHQISYEDEDPEILDTFLSELKKNGTEPKPVANWRRTIAPTAGGKENERELAETVARG